MIPSWNPNLKIYTQEGGWLASAILAERRAKDAARPEGLHLSTVLEDVWRTLYPGEYAKVDPTEAGDEIRIAFQEFGNTIEDILGGALAERFYRWTKPEPRLVRGIWCSPDGWQASSRTLDEIKATWKSRREFEEGLRFQKYCWQVLAYAYGWKAERARIHVFFVNGDYRPPVPSPPVTYVLKWEADAPARTFTILEQHAKDRGWL